MIYKAIREMKLGSKTSDLFCITFLGLCSYPDVTPFEPEFPSPRPNIEGPGPSCRDPIKVVHIADTHIDPLYVEGASTECGKPICCRYGFSKHLLYLSLPPSSWTNFADRQLQTLHRPGRPWPDPEPGRALGRCQL